MAAADIVTVPYAPRRAFLPLHERGERWAIVVAHRRAGKTVACLNELIRAAALCDRPSGARPRFAYVAPQLVQAKDIAWNYLLHYSECFGRGRKVCASELWIELPDNGARIRLYGGSERLRGLYYDGIVLDEVGDMAPETWSQVIRPTLNDYAGWAIFIGTPKGRNGFHRLWTRAEADPEWFTLSLKASETRLLDAKELADARKHMSDDEYAQEYECSFDAAVRGAYFAREMNALEAAGKISNVPHDCALPVHTAWDLGMADSTVIWFLQVCGRETRVIDVLKGEGQGLGWYVQQIRDRPAHHGHAGNWLWGEHYLPHDAEARELGTGKSRVETLWENGIRPTIVPRLSVEDGIQAVRRLLPMCWFDKARCHDGIEALKAYRRDYDSKRQELSAAPRHDWTSHYADALRCFAVGHREVPAAASRGPIRRDTRWVV